ncbi:hypothetical protein [Tychonema bourrellyi]|uniref:hypothetical protein n=1 Tax=Tychonema bourrellyi TaxID=54313 RepID=UPI001FE9816C|nr:hypothetical protein [Tychonema bourrellyi]
MAIFNKHIFEKIAVRIPKNLGWSIALLSGILMSLTTAPVNAWLLAWVALVPLWVLVVSYEQPKQEVKRQKVFFLPSSFFLLPSSFVMGNWLSRLSFVLDYGNSPDDLVGGSLVAEFGDRTFLLGLHHSLGSRISRRLGVAICDRFSHFNRFWTGKMPVPQK